MSQSRYNVLDVQELQWLEFPLGNHLKNGMRKQSAAFVVVLTVGKSLNHNNMLKSYILNQKMVEHL